MNTTETGIAPTEEHTVTLRLPGGMYEVIAARAEQLDLTVDEYLSSTLALNIPALP